MQNIRNTYPIVHPLTFIQNPLIKRMATDPHWTMSDVKKRPVHAKHYLETGDVINATFDNGSPLVPLAELDADKNLQAVNRAYRLRARENRIIVIDVEPEAPAQYKQDALSFPAHYTELSTNGGVHLLIEVPEDLVTDDNRYLFDDLSVYKEPVPQGEKRPAYFEVIFNDHFITFTKRMLTKKQPADLIHNQEEKSRIARFLNHIVESDKHRRRNRELAKQYQVELFEGSIPEDKKNDIVAFLNLKAFDVAKEQAGAKQASDFNNDLSSYEMSVACGLVSHIIRIRNLASGTQSFGSLVRKLDEQDLVYATYLLLKDAVPHREKHDEYRNNLPWLMYTAKGAYEYIKAKNAEQRNQK